MATQIKVKKVLKDFSKSRKHEIREEARHAISAVLCRFVNMTFCQLSLRQVSFRQGFDNVIDTF
jgi:hypothetical protein